MNNTKKIKYLIRDIVRKFGYEISPLGSNILLDSFILKLFKKDSNVQFLQIGANDGKMNDPIYKIANKLKMKGFAIEPVPKYYQELVKNYTTNSNVVPINYAVYESDTSIKMYIYEDNNSEEWTKGIASIFNDHYKKTNLKQDNLVEIEVKAIRFETLFDYYKIDRVDILIVDTEGYDYNIINLFPFDKFKPSIIQFEHNLFDNVMQPDQFGELVSKLVKIGYKISTNNYDCIAFLD